MNMTLAQNIKAYYVQESYKYEDIDIVLNAQYSVFEWCPKEADSIEEFNKYWLANCLKNVRHLPINDQQEVYDAVNEIIA